MTAQTDRADIQHAVPKPTTSDMGVFASEETERSSRPLRFSENIQGNVLAAFNKDQQMFLLVRFTDVKSSRAWLKAVEPLVSTTREIEDFNERFSNRRRTLGHDPADMAATWTGLALTADGLKMLGGEQVAKELEKHEAGPTGVFVEGAAKRAEKILGDTGRSAPENWYFGRSDQVVHAVLTLAADRPDDLMHRISRIRDINARHKVTEVYAQPGETLPGESAGREHFGFKDGISQPGVSQFHKAAPQKDSDEPDERFGRPGTVLVPPGHFVIGHTPHKVNSDKQFTHELTPDGTDVPQKNQTAGGSNTSVTVGPAWMKDGSFMVLRRMRQDVAGWWAQIERLGEAKNYSAEEKERLAAKFVGRWRSGASLAHHPGADPHKTGVQQDNNFDYGNDEHGWDTPRCSHIRKMTPRKAKLFDGDKTKGGAAETRRIMRRGIPFGPKFDPAGGEGTGSDAERGLVFVGYCSNLDRQFEFLQKSWADNTSFPFEKDGPDPVIGQSKNAAGMNCSLYEKDSGKEPVSFPLGRFVQTQGTLYAFVPSKELMRNLARGKTSAS